MELETPGPAVLVDNGDPASLAGMTPTLAPWEFYAPPEAALNVPAIRNYVLQEAAYSMSPVGYPGSVDSCITTFTMNHRLFL
jgi:hypothetical protein